MITSNESCLQKPKAQTSSRNKVFYCPHVIVKSAPRQHESYSQFGGELKVAKESGRRLNEWLIREEQEIDRKYKRTTL